jgi:hypothetical protein
VDFPDKANDNQRRRLSHYEDLSTPSRVGKENQSVFVGRV